MSPQTIAHYRNHRQTRRGREQVRRANDLKLGRDVTIKIPPETFSYPIAWPASRARRRCW
jgi:hypothetical protein